ncbi:hypothetical protein [Xenorhabdus siamensis]|uniref:hypothetical protein n=1 Tax=Xenorhabdus siamensis TaxID=3136254 RepID=UPI0030F47110
MNAKRQQALIKIILINEYLILSEKRFVFVMTIINMKKASGYCDARRISASVGGFSEQDNETIEVKEGFDGFSNLLKKERFLGSKNNQ